MDQYPLSGTRQRLQMPRRRAVALVVAGHAAGQAGVELAGEDDGGVAVGAADPEFGGLLVPDAPLRDQAFALGAFVRRYLHFVAGMA